MCEGFGHILTLKKKGNINLFSSFYKQLSKLFIKDLFVVNQHNINKTYLNSSDLQEYATRLKILMIGILLFLENL